MIADLPIDPGAPSGMRIFVTFQRVDGAPQRIIRLWCNADAPAFENDEARRLRYFLPVRRRQACVEALVEMRHARGMSWRCVAQGIERAEREVDIVRAGNAARSQQRMDVSREPFSRRSAEIKIVYRYRERVNAVRFCGLYDLRGERAFATSLQAR